MADKAVGLSERDVEQLQELLSFWRRSRNQLMRGNSNTDDLLHTPEVYVAWIPSAGIPASDGNVVSRTECDVYRVMSNSSSSYELTAISGLTRTLNNFGAAVPGNQWVLAVRDKWGEWFPGSTQASPVYVVKLIAQQDITPSTTCGTCEVADEDVTVTVSGITAGPADGNPCDDCTDYNATWTMHRIDDDCLWRTDDLNPCNDSGLSVATLYYQGQFNPPYWELGLGFAVYRCEPADFVCNGASTFTLAGINDDACAGWPRTVSVTCAFSAAADPAPDLCGWRALIQKKVGDTCTVGNDTYLEDADGNQYVLFQTAYSADDPGNPEAGDVTIAVPDPHQAGRWLFVPKPSRSDGAAVCHGCGWLMALQDDACLWVSVHDGRGLCLCIPDQTGFVMVRDSNWIGNGGWTSAGMIETCCGCGPVVFTPGVTPSTAELQLMGFHVACEEEGGSGAATSLLTFTLEQVCCEQKEDGTLRVVFVGWGEDACNDYDNVNPCQNVFYLAIECGGDIECPDPLCTCGCPVEVIEPGEENRLAMPASPNCWGIGPLALFEDNNLNGNWVLCYAPSDDNTCRWEGVCRGYYYLLEFVSGAAPYYRLTVNGQFEYRCDMADWETCQTNTLTYYDGDGNHPDAIAVVPMGGTDNLCEDCEEDFPEEISCTLESTLCPAVNGTYTLTYDWSTHKWEYTGNPLAQGVGTILFECTDGIFFLNVAGLCLAPVNTPIAIIADEDSPLSDLSFFPFYARWEGLCSVVTDSTGCCVNGCDVVAVITESA